MTRSASIFVIVQIEREGPKAVFGDCTIWASLGCLGRVKMRVHGKYRLDNLGEQFDTFNTSKQTLKMSPDSYSYIFEGLHRPKRWAAPFQKIRVLRTKTRILLPRAQRSITPYHAMHYGGWSTTVQAWMNPFEESAQMWISIIFFCDFTLSCCATCEGFSRKYWEAHLNARKRGVDSHTTKGEKSW